MALAPYVVGGLFAALMLAIATYDWRFYRVPDSLSAVALGWRGVDILLRSDSLELFCAAVARAVGMMATFYLFRLAYRHWRGYDGLGFGDVKLAAVAGAWVEIAALPYVVEAATLFGLGLAWRRCRIPGAALPKDLKIPFAAGFAPAIFLGWAFGSFAP